MKRGFFQNQADLTALARSSHHPLPLLNSAFRRLKIVEGAHDESHSPIFIDWQSVDRHESYTLYCFSLEFQNFQQEERNLVFHVNMVARNRKWCCLIQGEPCPGLRVQIDAQPNAAVP